MRTALLAVASSFAIACGGGSAGTSSSFTVSGVVTGATGATVSLEGPFSRTTITDGSGDFRFEELTPGEYTLSPSVNGYVFSPFSRTVTVSRSDIGGQNFTATVVPA